MIKKIKNIKLSKKQQTIIILAAIFIMMLVLNLLTPLLADDYSYGIGLDKTRIDSIIDIINFQVNHYLTWGGRTVAHTIAQCFLLFPKWIFSIANTFIYVALIYLIYLHAKGDNTKDKPLLLLLIHLALWYLLPVFGQTCLWLVGSCNYLWTTVIILFLLLQYRKDNNKNNSLKKAVAIFLLGILAAWTNENTSVGLLVVIIGLLVIKKLKHQKLKKWEISGLAGSILGFLILILAPGNFVRSESFEDNTFILVKLIKRVVEDTTAMLDYTMPLLILGVILITIYIYNRKKIKSEVFVYILAGFLTTYAMVLSPTFPARAWTGVFVFWIIACLQLIYNLDDINKIFNPIITDTIIILSLFYIIPFINTTRDVLNLNRVWTSRVEYIEKEKSKGNKDIEVEAYYNGGNHSPNYDVADIGSSKKGWPNEDVAHYFNIKSIKSISE